MLVKNILDMACLYIVKVHLHIRIDGYRSNSFLVTLKHHNFKCLDLNLKAKDMDDFTIVRRP